MKLIIVSGRSGSGKSICLHVLEDLGYYCIDNLPTALLPALIDQLREKYQLIAVSIDARNADDQLKIFHRTVEELKHSGVDIEIVYLDADDETLLKRYSQTHRKHPLHDDNTPLLEALAQERMLLEPITILADQTINSNSLTIHALRDLLHERLTHENTNEMALFIQSFGYKFGNPTDVDYIFDVRCLPNPHWEIGLTSYNGKDEAVALFLEQQPKTKDIMNDIITFLENWIPHYRSSNRRYLSVGIGCTGGQHRSVYIAEKLQAYFSDKYNSRIKHRELS